MMELVKPLEQPEREQALAGLQQTNIIVDTKVKVALRVRPMVIKEIAAEEQRCVACDCNSNQVWHCSSDFVINMHRFSWEEIGLSLSTRFSMKRLLRAKYTRFVREILRYHVSTGITRRYSRMDRLGQEKRIQWAALSRMM